MQTWRPLVPMAALALAAGLGACAEYPTMPANRRPMIQSVLAFPPVFGQGDSAMVTVLATDPDGDTLVYDWETDSRLIISGAPRIDQLTLYHTRSASRVFYRSTIPRFDGTAWVRCSVRDVRGGSDGRTVHFRLSD